MTREEAVERLVDYFEYEDGLSADKDMQEAYKMARKALEAEPTKHGRWIKDNGNWWHCSECGQQIFSMSEYDRNEFHKWCGRCGARMDEVEE